LCQKDLCKFSAEVFYLGLYLEYEIVHNNYLVNLLIALLKYATDRFENEDDKNFFLRFSPEISKIFTSIKEIKDTVGQIPNLLDLSSYNNLINSTSKSKPLLNWLIVSNPSIIIKINDDDINFDKYILDTADKQKEKIFKELLRTGLKNLSNTSRMTTGAVHGPGIYVSPNPSTALSYTNNNKLPIFALCEIIDVKNDKSKIKVVDDAIQVIKDENIIITRMLYVQKNEGYVKKPFNTNDVSNLPFEY
jgi:hypothetical protein